MIFHGEIIRRDKIYDYFKDSYAYVEMFLNYQHFGEPYSGGWMTWPCHVLDIIKVLEIESKRTTNG